MLSNRTNALSVASIVSASILIILMFILYPFMVPKIITSQSAYSIQQTSYLFYLVLTASIVLILACIGIISRRQRNLRSSSDRNRQSSSSFDHEKLRNKNKIYQDNRLITKENSDAISMTGDDGYTFSFIGQQSILSIMNSILNDRKYLVIFLISGYELWIFLFYDIRVLSSTVLKDFHICTMLLQHLLQQQWHMDRLDIYHRYQFISLITLE